MSCCAVRVLLWPGLCLEGGPDANRVVPDGQAYAQAMTLAQSLAAKPPTALKLTKALMRSDPAAIAARMQAEGQHFSAQLVSPEAREAFSAFIEKRPPDFSKAS